LLTLLSVTGTAGANSGLPFVRKYCLSCHDTAKKKGDVDLSRFESEASVVSARKLWLAAIRNVKNGEMPPPSAKQPTPDERERAVGFT
jgi:hypothetical protein